MIGHRVRRRAADVVAESTPRLTRLECEAAHWALRQVLSRRQDAAPSGMALSAVQALRKLERRLAGEATDDQDGPGRAILCPASPASPPQPEVSL